MLVQPLIGDHIRRLPASRGTTPLYVMEASLDGPLKDFTDMDIKRYSRHEIINTETGSEV
jgi:hypothetical protein